MIEINQTISDKDYKKVIALHYFGYKYTFINPILGILIILITIIFGIRNPEIFDEKIVFLILISLFLIIRPFLYIRNIFKSSKSNKTLMKKTNIKITDDDKIVTTVGENVSTISFKDLYSYFDKKTFLLLYLARNQYLIIDKKIMSNSQVESLINTLNRLKIRKR